MASYYVSPQGGGRTFTELKPGALNAAINRAVAGDEIVLMDGAYQQFIRFKRSGEPGKPITMRAQNQNKALIELPQGVREGKSGGSNSVVNTRPFRHITIRGLLIDGRGGGESGITADDGANLVIELNRVRNTGSGGISMKGSSDSIIRFNVIEDCGKSFLGEGMYVGQASGEAIVRNIEIYGNTVRRSCMNFIDMKRGNENVNVHHNIFEDLLVGRDRPDLDARSFSDGLVIMGSAHVRGSRFTDNIIRRVKQDNPSQIFKVSQYSNHVIERNVVKNVNNQLLISGHQDGTLIPSVVAYNTFFSLASYDVTERAGPLGGVVITENKVAVTEAEYDAEEQRIVAEWRILLSRV